MLLERFEEQRTTTLRGENVTGANTYPERYAESVRSLEDFWMRAAEGLNHLADACADRRYSAADPGAD